MEKDDIMIGKKFGYLIVQDEIIYKGDRKYRKCRCDCGKICYIQESHLKSGHTKSCGCYRRQLRINEWLDLTGQRYGRLKVLQFADEEILKKYNYDFIKRLERNKKIRNSNDLWLCQCDCGNICICHKESLRGKRTQSCGCYQKEQRKKNFQKAIHFVDRTCIEKIVSSKLNSNNTSGQRGVYRRKNGTWRASIGFQGKVYNLGTFDDFNQAVQARLEAEKVLYKPFVARYWRKEQ